MLCEYMLTELKTIFEWCILTIQYKVMQFACYEDFYKTCHAAYYLNLPFFLHIVEAFQFFIHLHVYYLYIQTL